MTVGNGGCTVPAMMKPAGLAARIGAWILDLAIIVFLGLALGRYEVDILPNMSSIDTNAAAMGVLLLIFWMTMIPYHLVELLTGRSPAKWILGLSVRRRDGGKARLGRRLVRCLGNIVPLLIVSGLGVLTGGKTVQALAILTAIAVMGVLPLLGPTRPSLADLLAGTVLQRGSFRNEARPNGVIRA